MGKVTKIEIIKGDVRDFFIKLIDAETGDGIDLSTASEITVTLPAPSGSTNVTRTLTGGGVALVPSAYGKIAVNLTATNTDDLDTGKGMNIMVEYIIAGVTRSALLRSVLDVLDDEVQYSV